MPSLPEPDTLDLTRFAEVMAHLRRFPEAKKSEVLARLGVAEPAWEAAFARWSAARDGDFDRGAADVPRRFGIAFARALKRLEKDRPTLESLDPLAVQSPAPAPAPPPAPAPAPVAAAPLVAPSPAPAPVAPPPVVRAPSHLAGTLPLGTELPIARLPFVQGPAEQALASAIAHARAVQGAPPVAARAAAHGATVGVSDVPRGPALPFGRSPAAAREATVGLSQDAAGGVPVPEGVPDLTVQQYASFRVELQLDPGRADAILQRYGVAPGARPALDDHWRARFDADPLLRMMFAKAYATYLGWIRERQGAK